MLLLCPVVVGSLVLVYRVCECFVGIEGSQIVSFPEKQEKKNKNEIFESIKYSSLTGPVIAPRTIDKNKVIISIRRHQF